MCGERHAGFGLTENRQSFREGEIRERRHKHLHTEKLTVTSGCEVHFVKGRKKRRNDLVVIMDGRRCFAVKPKHLRYTRPIAPSS